MHFPHTSYATFEPPDLAYWHLIGNVDESDIHNLFKEQVPFSQGKTAIYMLIDVSRLETMTQGARRAAAGGPEPGKKVVPLKACAVIGASFAIQVLGLMLAKASRVLNRDDDLEIHYCDNETQARAWIDKRRKERKD